MQRRSSIQRNQAQNQRQSQNNVSSSARGAGGRETHVLGNYYTIHHQILKRDVEAWAAEWPLRPELQSAPKVLQRTQGNLTKGISLVQIIQHTEMGRKISSTSVSGLVK